MAAMHLSVSVAVHDGSLALRAHLLTHARLAAVVGRNVCTLATTLVAHAVQAIAEAACGRGIDMISVANLVLAMVRGQGWQPRADAAI